MNKKSRDNSYLLGNQFAKGNEPNQTSFKKGMIAWNKGQKGTHFSPATEFKRGQQSRNRLPLGSIVQRRHKKDGIRNWIKIAEPSKWGECAKYLWKQYYGFLIVGDVTHHLNGIRLDDRIENIIALPRPDHPIFHNRCGLKKLTQEQLRFYRNRYLHHKLCLKCGGWIDRDGVCINCGYVEYEIPDFILEEIKKRKREVLLHCRRPLPAISI